MISDVWSGSTMCLFVVFAFFFFLGSVCILFIFFFFFFLIACLSFHLLLIRTRSPLRKHTGLPPPLPPSLPPPACIRFFRSVNTSLLVLVRRASAGRLAADALCHPRPPNVLRHVGGVGPRGARGDDQRPSEVRAERVEPARRPAFLFCFDSSTIRRFLLPPTQWLRCRSQVEIVGVPLLHFRVACVSTSSLDEPFVFLLAVVFCFVFFFPSPVPG